jgi:hypothetical protein
MLEPSLFERLRALTTASARAAGLKAKNQTLEVLP